MEWFKELIVSHSAIQAVIVISLISTLGLALGKIRILGISLGVTFVFFVGIMAGHFGLSIDPRMLNYAESFGLVLFVYTLGLQVGPGFFSAFHSGGIRQVMAGVALVLLGTLTAVALGRLTGISLPDMVGVLCGATTNTPALGAAQQTLKQLGLPGSGPALSCAVTYPLGVIGVILAIAAVRKLFVRPADLPDPDACHRSNTFITEFRVTNPGIFGRNIRDVAALSQHRFVISRLWRDGQVSIPTSDKTLQEGDRLLVVTTREEVGALTVIFGHQRQRDWNKNDIDWNAIDRQLISQRIVVTRPEINGKKLSSLRLRNLYGINISRVLRSGVQLLATPDLTLQLGDSLTVVGEQEAINNVEKILGNAVKSLKEPNLISIFLGLVLGLALGAIPIMLPGIGSPVKLGLAGGPIIVGILIGTFGPRLHMVTYTTLSANLMLRALGLSIYLACLGLDAGRHFFETVMRPEGVMWLWTGFVVTFVPVALMAIFLLRVMRMDYGSISGILCGSMANPMALNYANDTIPSDRPAVAYATVYPVCMFLRVIIAQVLLLFLL
ncbi:MAG: putative transporter [Rikenellaceae bacterium]|nr:putative transporter [Rikenellaceae bacterium]